MTYYNKCDTHTHTLFSKHAFSTIEENVREAAAKGMEVLVCTEHFGNMVAHTYDIKSYQHIYNLSTMAPKVWHGVRLLNGVEADIIDSDGHLFGYDIPVDANIVEDKEPETTLLERITRPCVYIIASLHGRDFCRHSPASDNTRMYLKVLENPRVKILGHLGRTGINLDVDEVLKEVKAQGKFIELNEHSFHFTQPGIRERCTYIASRCAELGIGVTLGSDAHISYAVGSFEGVFEMLREVDFPQELIISRDKATFLKAIGIDE